MHCNPIGYQTQILTGEANASFGEHRRSVVSLIAIDKQQRQDSIERSEAVVAEPLRTMLRLRFYDCPNSFRSEDEFATA